MKKSVMLIIGCLFFHYNTAQEIEVMSKTQKLNISQEEYNDLLKHSNDREFIPIINKRLVLESGETKHYGPSKSGVKKTTPLKRGGNQYDLFKESIIPEINNQNQ